MEALARIIGVIGLILSVISLCMACYKAGYEVGVKESKESEEENE